jgi:hypothetical protein
LAALGEDRKTPALAGLNAVGSKSAAANLRTRADVIDG